MNIIAKIGTYTLFLYTLEYNHRLPASDFLDTCLFCSATGDRRTDLTDRRKKKCDDPSIRVISCEVIKGVAREYKMHAFASVSRAGLNCRFGLASL
jgi:hypothetical protein